MGPKDLGMEKEGDLGMGMGMAKMEGMEKMEMGAEMVEVEEEGMGIEAEEEKGIEAKEAKGFHRMVESMGEKTWRN